MKFDVICLGSATIDHFLTIHRKLRSITYGTKVLVKNLETHTGGGGSNAAVALAKLSLKVAYLGKLGQDDKAKVIEKEFNNHKIKILNKRKSKLHTDEGFILNSEQERDRIIYVHKGSSEDLDLKDIPRKLNCKWIYLGTLLGKSSQITKYILKQRAKILFNPSTYLAKQGLSKLKPILKRADILILNREEAQLIVKKKKNLLPELSKHTLGTIIITNGPNKVRMLHQNKVYTALPPKVKVKHTAGAGDAFNSGFLAGMIKGYDIKDCLRLGLAESISVIQHVGTKNKLLTEAEAKKLMRGINVSKH